MRKPLRLLVAALTIPFLTGCFTVIPAPLPSSPEAGEEMRVRGVVVGADIESGEEIRFDDIRSVEWTANSVSIVGTQVSDGQIVDRTFPLSSLAAILVREVDAAKTSGIIGGTIVGTLVVLAVLVSGSFEPG